MLLNAKMTTIQNCKKLANQKAVLCVTGMYDDIEEQKLEKDIIEFKNTFLIPIYASIKNLIRKIKFSELDEIYNDYQLSLLSLSQSKNNNVEDEKIKIERSYLSLIQKVRSDLEKPENKLRRLHQKLLLIVNLLLKWKEYTKILQMTFEETKEKMDMKYNPEQIKDQKEGYKKAKEEINLKKESYLNGEDEDADFETMFDEKIVKEQATGSSKIQDFLKENNDLISNYMSQEQIMELESDFERMKESNDSIYGKLRKQKKVNSDDFFKDFLMNQNNENPDFQESKDENNVQQNPFFDTLNLIYKNVKSLD